MNLRQPDLASITGVAIRSIYDIEAGRGNPSTKVLTKIADALGLVLKLELKTHDNSQHLNEKE